MKTYTDPFDRANGPLGSVPSGPAWEALSGTFAITSNRLTSSTAPGSSPIAVINTGVRSNGKADIDMTATAQHYQGNAMYFRVLDLNNWWRVRMRYYSYSYQYYNTEYQHVTYKTQYEWNDYMRTTTYYPRRSVPGWQPMKQVKQIYRETRSYSAWSGYSDTGLGGDLCRASQPAWNMNPETDSWGNNIKEYSVRTNATGCPTNQRKYFQTARTRTGSTTAVYVYQEMSYTPVWTSTTHETATGTTTTINNGSVYYAMTKSGTYDVATGTSQIQSDPTRSTYTVISGRYGVADGSKQDSLDTDGGGTNSLYQTIWTDTQVTPSAYDTPTGNTRQAVASSYWDSTYEAGAPTRQVGPYTGTAYDYITYLEKNVGGTVTSVGQYSSASSTVRVLAQGSGINVYLNGTLRIATTDTTHMSAGKVGLGGAPSDIATNPSWDNFSVTLLSPYMVRVGGSWINRNPRYFNGTSWVETDPQLL